MSIETNIRGGNNNLVNRGNIYRIKELAKRSKMKSSTMFFVLRPLTRHTLIDFSKSQAATQNEHFV